MESKEKAIQLRDKYIFTSFNTDEDYKSFKLKLLIHAKQCALIAVDELINQSRNTAIVYDLSFDESENYWVKVKQEIKNL
jgi:hypothetical protein